METIELPADDFVAQRMKQISDYTQNNPDHVTTLDWYADNHRVERVRVAFDELAKLSYESRFKVSVLIIPYVSRHIESHAWAYEIVRYEAEKRGFKVIEVLEDFLVDDILKLRVRETDFMHPNATGHTFMAERLLDSTLENLAQNAAQSAQTHTKQQ